MSSPPVTSCCPIVFACDEGYAMPLATAMRSLVDENRSHWPLHVYVMSDGFSEKSRQKIIASLPAGSAKIEWPVIDLRRFAGMATISHISPITYARLVMDEILPRDVERVLYLDADLLVLGDLAPLWRWPLNGACVAAVPDLGLDPLIQIDDPRARGVPKVRRYLNAGVLLIDLQAWRAHHVAGKALAYMQAHPDTPFSDQDALNAVLDGLWVAADVCWNDQHHLERDIGALPAVDRPRIVHFVTAAKPWKPQYRSRNAALHDRYRRRTRYSKTPATAIKGAIEQAWFDAKALLKRYALVQAAWAYAKRRSST